VQYIVVIGRSCKKWNLENANLTRNEPGANVRAIELYKLLYNRTEFSSQILNTLLAFHVYATKVLAVALSYLQVGGRAPTVL